MTVLRSYVGGAWTEPAGRGAPGARRGDRRGSCPGVRRPAIDMAAALDYGRSSGGPALRELTFHQRAALLKSLGQLLREHRPGALHAVRPHRARPSGTPSSTIDGGIGVLLSYASRAKRELPNDTILAEGAVEPLGRAGDLRRPAYPSRRCTGVAVQIKRVQLPGLGATGEVRPGVHRRDCRPWSSRPPRPRT